MPRGQDPLASGPSHNPSSIRPLDVRVWHVALDDLHIGMPRFAKDSTLISAAGADLSLR